MENQLDYDVVVIGAGLGGLYQLYRLLELGMTVKVIEEAPDVGGTWYWNCYPGARFDSESYSYGYLFSKELFQEWRWSEHFAAQPEVLGYIRYVTDKFQLRPHIQFNTRVSRCEWLEEQRAWQVSTQSGESLIARYIITAVGVLSATHVPEFDGMEDFGGSIYHTSRWPQDGVELRGKRVAVIGTGSTGVQLIQTIASDVAQLVVFQRTASFTAPLHNSKVTPHEQDQFAQNYEQLVERVRSTPGAFIHAPDERKAAEVSEAEREAYYERRWSEPGFGKWLGLYADTLSDPESNGTIAEFARRKIRSRVKDPAVADLLTPKTQPFGGKRIPLEKGYYEVFNRGNVDLVDLRSEPILRFTSKGILTSAREYELDTIVLATGFDAVTGNLVRIDIRGRNGESLAESFKKRPRSYMGLQISGFPNFFPISGPVGGFVFCNVPRCLEENVDWVTECLKYMLEKGYTVSDVDGEAENEWLVLVNESAKQTILPGTESWFNGANIPGKPRAFQMYMGGLQEFRRLYTQMVDDGYVGFKFQ